MAAAFWHVPFTVPEMSTGMVPPSGPGVVPCSTAASENVALLPLTVNEKDVMVNESHVSFVATVAVVSATDHVRVHDADGSDIVDDDRVPPSLTVKSNIAVPVYPLFVMYGQVHVPANGLAGVEVAPLPPEVDVEQAAPRPAKRAADKTHRGATPVITTTRLAHQGYARKGSRCLAPGLPHVPRTSQHGQWRILGEVWISLVEEAEAEHRAACRGGLLAVHAALAESGVRDIHGWDPIHRRRRRVASRTSPHRIRMMFGGIACRRVLSRTAARTV